MSRAQAFRERAGTAWESGRERSKTNFELARERLLNDRVWITLTALNCIFFIFNCVAQLPGKQTAIDRAAWMGFNDFLNNDSKYSVPDIDQPSVNSYYILLTAVIPYAP